jgi:hypothetical protein
MPSEAETARRAGNAAEKTNEVPLIRWGSTAICEPAQNPPDEFRPAATEPTSVSICVACATCGEFTTARSMGDTHSHVIKFRETASSSAYGAEGNTLIQNQAIFTLELQLDLFMKVRRPSCLVSCKQLTIFGKSIVAQSFSNMPSVTIARGPRRFRRSFLRSAALLRDF